MSFCLERELFVELYDWIERGKTIIHVSIKKLGGNHYRGVFCQYTVSFKNSSDSDSSGSLASLEEPEWFCNSFVKRFLLCFFQMAYEENIGGADRSYVFMLWILTIKQLQLLEGCRREAIFCDRLVGFTMNENWNHAKFFLGC